MNPSNKVQTTDDRWQYENLIPYLTALVGAGAGGIGGGMLGADVAYNHLGGGDLLNAGQAATQGGTEILKAHNELNQSLGPYGSVLASPVTLPLAHAGMAGGLVGIPAMLAGTAITAGGAGVGGVGGAAGGGGLGYYLGTLLRDRIKKKRQLTGNMAVEAAPTAGR